MALSVPGRSAAPWLALIYAVLVVYASLYPFAGWRWPGSLADPRPWLLPWPPWRNTFDEVANLAGYAPFGLLVFVSRLRAGRGVGVAALVGMLVPALASWALEMAQAFLPSRVPSARDWALNAAGAAVGVALGLALRSAGVFEHWQRWRGQWFQGQAHAGLVLLLMWPVVLLFPAPVTLGLGQVFGVLGALLQALWIDSRLAEAVVGTVRALVPGAATATAPLLAVPSAPLTGPAEAIAVALGFLAPCAVAFAVMPAGWRRQAMLVALGGAAVATTALATALNFGPAHALAWLTPAVGVGLLLGGVLGVGLALLRRDLVAAVGLVAIAAGVALVSRAPQDPYFAASLQLWQQGQFIRFHGLAQWVGWVWPYAAGAWLAARLGARAPPGS